MAGTSEHEFEAIGTRWHVQFELDPQSDESLLMAAIHKRIDRFDKNYSRFRGDSLVTKMSQKPGRYLMPHDAHSMLKLYQDLYGYTGGAFTPLIGSTLAEAGYDANYSLTPNKMHAPPPLEEALTYEPPYMTLHQRVLFDFGAAGKGYLVDLIADMLKENGALSFTIDAGGDIVSYSARGVPVRIGLEHPEDTTQVIGVATILDQSICGSAGNRRTWSRFHHIIDPHKLESPQNVRATWVVAKTAMLADALATCLYLVPAVDLTPHYSFEYLLVRPDYSIERSPDFPAEIFTH
jgi:thiamine biosynthesis lipoprotein